jgi:arylsulfatase A-like enzyme
MKNYRIWLFCILILLFKNAQAQRNVILIIADDLSPDYFGFYDDHVDTVEVPNLRKLVQKGIKFKNCFANPVCSSTRTTMLTGRYSFRTNVGYIVGSTQGSGQIDSSEITIPRLLNSYNSSISTANIGKWHLNNPNPVSNLLFPNILGYQHFEGPFIGAINNYSNWTKYTNGVASTVTTYATTEQVNNAISWIKSVNNSSPFFLWLAFNSPHDPLHLPPADLHNFSGLSGLPADINANPKPYFKAMIQAMDHEIGRLFDSLQVLNRLDSTDIVFIGDNGNSMRTAQITNIGRAKGTIYEYGIHVPLIIAGPSVISPNRSSDELVNTVDIFATVQELMGNLNWISQIPTNRPVDTHSLLPIIINNNVQIRPWAFSEIFKIITDSADGKSIRNMEYKLLKFDNGQEEFYNLSVDPLESNNLLTASLGSIELINYNYLCGEMTNLLAAGNYCNSLSGETNITNSRIKVYPNPFINNIHYQSKNSQAYFQFYNYDGSLIYEGNNISHQDFSRLPSGIYFLNIIDQNKTTIKLIKK